MGDCFCFVNHLPDPRLELHGAWVLCTLFTSGHWALRTMHSMCRYSTHICWIIETSWCLETPRAFSDSTLVSFISHPASAHPWDVRVLKAPSYTLCFLILFIICIILVSSVASHVWLFVTPWITTCQASLSITNSRSSLKLTSIKSVMPSSHLIFCHCLLLLPQILPSIRVFAMSQLFAWGGQSPQTIWHCRPG